MRPDVGVTCQGPLGDESQAYRREQLGGGGRVAAFVNGIHAGLLYAAGAAR